MMTDESAQRPQSLLPYEQWNEEAMRHVMRRALGHVAEEGLPGEHHFYVSFRTDAPGVVMPQRLRAQYPREMTIVLQHQFWELNVTDEQFSVGLSFGGVPTVLVVPLAAVSAFADPHAGVGMRFQSAEQADADGTAELFPLAAVDSVEADASGDAPDGSPADAAAQDGDATDAAPQVVSLDAFRRRTPKN